MKNFLRNKNLLLLLKEDKRRFIKRRFPIPAPGYEAGIIHVDVVFCASGFSSAQLETTAGRVHIYWKGIW
jgi:hypothetical protein